jgi:hypothetical protein
MRPSGDHRAKDRGGVALKDSEGLPFFRHYAIDGRTLIENQKS